MELKEIDTLGMDADEAERKSETENPVAISQEDAGYNAIGL